MMLSLCKNGLADWVFPVFLGVPLHFVPGRAFHCIPASPGMPFQSLTRWRECGLNKKTICMNIIWEIAGNDVAFFSRCN